MHGKKIMEPVYILGIEEMIINKNGYLLIWVEENLCLKDLIPVNALIIPEE